MLEKRGRLKSQNNSLRIEYLATWLRLKVDLTEKQEKWALLILFSLPKNKTTRT